MVAQQEVEYAVVALGHAHAAGVIVLPDRRVAHLVVRPHNQRGDVVRVIDGLDQHPIAIIGIAGGPVAADRDEPVLLVVRQRDVDAGRVDALGDSLP